MLSVGFLVSSSAWVVPLRPFQLRHYTKNFIYECHAHSCCCRASTTAASNCSLLELTQKSLLKPQCMNHDFSCINVYKHPASIYTPKVLDHCPLECSCSCCASTTAASSCSLVKKRLSADTKAPPVQSSMPRAAHSRPRRSLAPPP